MLASQSKKIRENVSRAVNMLQRGEFIKAVEYASKALRAKSGVALRMPERIEVEGRLGEFCRDLSANPRILAFLESIKIRKKPFVAYKPGTEELTASRLDILATRMAEVGLGEAGEAPVSRAKNGVLAVQDEARGIRENLARARHSLRRGEFARSARWASESLKGLMAAKDLKRAERFEIGCHIEEYCRDLSNHPKVVAFLETIKIRKRPYVEHRPGAERQTVVKLDVLATRMLEKERQAGEDAARERVRSREKSLSMARESLEAGEYPRARAYLRRAAEEHLDEPEVVAEAGRMLLDAGLPADAADILEPGRERHPGDGEILRVLVLAHRANQNFEKAEALYMEALSRFGAHPQTLLNMATLYRDWRKMDKAYQYAVQALDLDPELDEARDIVDRMDNRGRRAG